MMKRTGWILTVLVGVGTIFWLSRSYRLVKVEPLIAGQSQATKTPTQHAGDSSDGQTAGTEVPESARHAAGEIEKYRQSGMDALDQAVRDQEARVEERRKVLATIVRNKGVIYRGPDAAYGQPPADEEQYAKNALQAYNDLQTQKIQLESQINSLLKYDDQQLMTYAAGLDLPDNAVKVLYPQYLEAKRELDLLKRRGLGDQHPTLLAQAEQVAAIELQMNESVANVRASLQGQLDMATDRLKGVGMKGNTRDEAIKRGLDAQDYVDAKRDFETDQQLLQEMKLKQISEKVKEKAGR